MRKEVAGEAFLLFAGEDRRYRTAHHPALDRGPIVLWLVVTFMGGVSGYIGWLSGDQTRYKRFEGVASLSAVVAICVILLAFPGLWWWLRRAGGATFGVCFWAESVVRRRFSSVPLGVSLTWLATYYPYVAPR